MANKKKNTKKEEEKKTKKVVSKDKKKPNEKENKKEKEFEKLVAEEELEVEDDDFDEIETSKNIKFSEEDEEDSYEAEEEDYDDEDESDVIANEVKELDPESEIKVLRMLTCVSICIAVITLLISLIILGKVSHIDSYYQEETSKKEEEDSYDTSMFEEISVDEFVSMFDEDDDEIRFVYTGTGGCAYCVAFLPSLQQSVEEYDYTLYYLPTDIVTSSDITEISALDEDLNENFPATPMVYAIKNGEVIDYNDGYTEYSTYTSFLEDNGVEAK